MPQIFIGGDSWGTGELPDLTHLGIEQYFREDGYTVFNSSTRGASNRDSIGLLLENLKLHYQTGDQIFWIQTDPIRNLNPVMPDTELPKELGRAGGLVSLMTQLLAVDYDRLHSTARRFDTKIHLIGGLHSINQDLVASRPRLTCLVASWPRLLVEDQYPDLNWRNFRLYTGGWTVDNLRLEELHDIELAGIIIDELYEMDQNEKIFRNPIFQPDGKYEIP